MVSSMSVKIAECLVLVTPNLSVTPILHAARVIKVLIVNATIMVCHVMVVLVVYATQGIHYGSHSNYMP